MTAQTDTRAGAVRPAPPVPRLTESAQAAHFRAYAAKHGRRYRRAARRDAWRTLLGMLAVAAVHVPVVGLFTLLSPGDRQTAAGTGILVIVGAFAAVSIRAARNVRPAPPAPTPAPSPCICGNAPTLRHKRGAATGEYWLYTCAPPCDAALCAQGDTLDAALAAWERVVSEARATLTS